MIKSMTGFGRCEAADEERKFTVEMKGVNHRYLDANIRMPKKLNFFESAIRSLLKESVHRGKVDIFITYEDFSESQVSLKYNETLAAEYLEKFKMMEEKFSLENDIRVSTLSRYPEVLTMEEKMDDDTESIITNERYTYITSIIGKCVKKATGKEKLTTSDKIDKIVTNRFAALPIFALIMFVVYYVSVTTVGAFLTDWTNDTLFGEWIIPGAQSFFDNIGCAAWLSGLIVDGIISGVGAVLGFVPQMLVLFIFLAFLEGCGYICLLYTSDAADD